MYKVKQREFKIFGSTLVFMLVAPKTCWSINSNPVYHKSRMRQDKIFAITRIYSREVKDYLWSFVIGRLKILWMNW